MKVIIAGGRDFADYPKLRRNCNYLLKFKQINDLEIVSGKAKGADNLGERYAREKGIHVVDFPARWDEFGRSAGYKRNTQMAEYADCLILFWDGKSRGSKHMLNIAKQHNLEVRLIRY